jgi:tetratricopeptide (TPR) repeat protein
MSTPAPTRSVREQVRWPRIGPTIGVVCLWLVCGSVEPPVSAAAAPEADTTSGTRSAQPSPAYRNLMRAARSLEKEGKLPEARARYTRAAKLEPDVPDAHLRIYGIYVAQRNWSRAAKAALNAFNAESTAKTRAAVFECARRNLRNRDVKRARPLLEALYEGDPNDLATLDQLVGCYNRLKQFDDAVRVGTQGVKAFLAFYADHPDKKPYRRPFLTDFAEALARQKALEQALEVANALWADAPDEEPRRIVLAVLLGRLAKIPNQQERPEEAMALLRRATELTPTDPTPHRELASMVREQEGREAGVEMLRGMLERFPHNVPLKSDLAKHLFALKHFEEAETLYRQLAEAAGGPTSYHTQILGCLLGQTQFEQAESFLNTFLAEFTSTATPKERRRITSLVGQGHVKVARTMRNTRPLQGEGDPESPKREAIAYLERQLDRSLDEGVLQKELASFHLADGHYEQALSLYTEMATQRPQDAEVLEKRLECLGGLRRFDEAEQLLAARVAEIQASPFPPQGKRQTIASLEERFQDILDGSDLLRDRLEGLAAQVADAPTSPALRNALGDLMLRGGQSNLALGEHLKGAYLADNADHFIEQALKAATASRGEDALAYLQAVRGHFPTHPRIFDVLERLIDLRGERDSRRFAFSPRHREACRMAEETCQGIAETEDVASSMRLEATLRAWRYHHEILPNDPEMWTELLSRLEAKLAHSDMTSGLREWTLEWMVGIQTDYLNNPRAAFQIQERLMRENPSVEAMKQLARAACALTPPPDPSVLREFLQRERSDAQPPTTDDKEARKRERELMELDAFLAAWMWAAGNEDDALEALAPLMREARRGGQAAGAARKSLHQLRRTMPDFAARLQPPEIDPTTTDMVEVLAETVRESNWENVLPGDPLIERLETRLELPRELFAGQTVRVFAGEKPAVVRPATFVHPQTHRPDETSEAEETDGLPWTATWHAATEKDASSGGYDTFVLESAFGEAPNEELAMRRRLTSEFDENSPMESQDAEKPDSYLIEVALRSEAPCELVLTAPEGFGWPYDLEPPTGEVSENGTRIAFDIASDSLDDEGTTVSFRLRPQGRQRPSFHTQPALPEVEVRYDAGVTEGALDRLGLGRWAVDFPPADVRFEIDLPTDIAQSIPARLTSRTVYRFGTAARRR